jgi:hypothetical protein
MGVSRNELHRVSARQGLPAACTAFRDKKRAGGFSLLGGRMSATPYTVQRCRATDNPDGTPRLYGSVHGSWTSNETLCGENISDQWVILTNKSDGTVTCPKCCKAVQRKSAQ